MRTSTSARTYLMCPPEHFAVEYAINPWMNPALPVDAALAMRQWQRAAGHYGRLGHTVHTIRPEPGLPDMVFAANGATVIDGKVLGARFRHAERPPEAAAYLAWFREQGYGVVRGRGRRQRGRGRHRVRRARHPGRPRLPQRTRRSVRAGRAVRAAGDQPAPGGPALLPPRHRAVSCSMPTPPPTTRPRSTTPAGPRWRRTSPS